MATEITNGERLNNAIIKRLAQILESARPGMYEMKINIEGDAGTCPIIHYDITERIILEGSENG